MVACNSLVDRPSKLSSVDLVFKLRISYIYVLCRMHDKYYGIVSP